MYHNYSFSFGVSGICSRSYYMGTGIEKEESMGDHQEQQVHSLFSELTDYEKEGIHILLNGLPASPMQVVQAHIMREDSVYMRDYVLNEKGDIKELCFNNVDQRISEHEYPSN